MQLVTKYVKDNLSIATDMVQATCIGLFKSHVSHCWELVLDDDNGFLTTIWVGNLLGVTTTYIHSKHGTYAKFPDNKSMTEMKEDPIAFDNWYKKNIK